MPSKLDSYPSPKQVCEEYRVERERERKKKEIKILLPVVIFSRTPSLQTPRQCISFYIPDCFRYFELCAQIYMFKPKIHKQERTCCHVLSWYGLPHLV